jgi:plastocyanin
MTLFLGTVVTAGGIAAVFQVSRAFSLLNLQIQHGDVVRFSNNDKFLHQIYVDSAAFNFESAEQEPGSDVEVLFPNAGVFEVRCHIHPKMLLKVDAR